MEKIAKRIWFGALMVVATWLVIVPVGLLTILFHGLAMSYIVFVDMLTKKDLVADHEVDFFPGIADDLNRLKRYHAQVRKAILVFIDDDRPTPKPTRPPAPAAAA